MQCVRLLSREWGDCHWDMMFLQFSRPTLKVIPWSHKGRWVADKHYTETCHSHAIQFKCAKTWMSSWWVSQLQQPCIHWCVPILAFICCSFTYTRPASNDPHYKHFSVRKLPETYRAKCRQLYYSVECGWTQYFSNTGQEKEKDANDRKYLSRKHSNLILIAENAIEREKDASCKCVNLINRMIMHRK